ncbi:MAG: hypothetical protein ABI939_01225 [Anaerolineaceae bacterium]
MTIFAAGLALSVAGLAAFMGPSESVAASGPCTVTGAGLDAEETQFLGLLQQWRASNLGNPAALETSVALNSAAAWFAQWQVDNGGLGGHFDSFGRNWVQRAVDCGYDPNFAGGSGEGIYAVASSGALSIGPSQAILGITYPGSGVRIVSPSPSWPAKCVGVAVKRNAAGTIVAWVAVIAQYPAASPCPAGSGSTEPPPSSATATATSTATKTATPTSTPTKTPTPSPTPTPRTDGATIDLAPGWNLVVIPPGSLDEVLYRAKGCFRSVYQQQGERWVRYSPEVPAYARNLQTSNGGVFWVEGTAEGCGRIPL